MPNKVPTGEECDARPNGKAGNVAFLEFDSLAPKMYLLICNAILRTIDIKDFKDDSLTTLKSYESLKSFALNKKLKKQGAACLERQRRFLFPH
jgi:hypothetical protein